MTEFRVRAVQVVEENCSGILGRSYDAVDAELVVRLEYATNAVEAWLKAEAERNQP